MPRSNSLSSNGSSLTSDEEVISPTAAAPQPIPAQRTPRTQTVQTTPASPTSPTSATASRRRAVSPGAVSPDAPSPRSLRSTRDAPMSSQLGPGAIRFRSVVKKVMHMNRASVFLNKLSPGAEPGIDPRRHSATALYGNIRQECDITVADYSAVRTSFQTLDNDGLRAWLARKDHVPEPWVKVRWIHVNGISWDVLSALALEYEIHPLALEDVIHSRHTSRSKANYFSHHLFLRVLCHSVAGEPNEEPTITNQPRSFSPVEFDEKDDEMRGGIDSKGGLFRRNGGRGSTMLRSMRDLEAPDDVSPTATITPQWRNPDEDLKRQARAAKIAVLTEGDRVQVELRNLFIFLWRDGTVVSIYQTPKSEFAAPIIARLRPIDTILRSTADASLLVQSMLDLVVDQVLEMVDKYHDQIAKLESAILIKPKVNLVRALHIMSGDLSLRKRTLEPLMTMIYGLRRYDLDRCVALANSVNEGETGGTPKVVGFMSHKSKIYLADVHDHMTYILSSMELFASVCENLISYTFNMSGYLTNETMRLLTLVTIIFLPLTLLTGYFGMNFNPFPAVNNHSDILFWEIGLPVMAVIIPLFLWGDILRGVHFVQKSRVAKKVSRAVKAGQPVPQLSGRA